MITTSKYEENGFDKIIEGLVQVYNPKIVVELGTQQGASAIIIGKALKDGKLWTFDLFDEKYPSPPYSDTKADLGQTLLNIKEANMEDKIVVVPFDAMQVYKQFPEVDILHIDLCNHYHNVEPLLIQWRYKVNRCMILEGGGYNKWQQEHNFQPFYLLLGHHFVTDNYHVSIIKKNEDYALTILTRYSS
jgi:hypothetical protein